MPVHIGDIDYLLAVAETANISRAADQLGISQPALTKAIHRIELDVGIRLFERNAKGVLLTEAGQAFIRRASRISLEYADAVHEMQQMRTGGLGVLRIGYSPTVNEPMVLDICKKLLRERPAAQLQLRERLSGELFAMLRGGELDIMLAPLPDGDTTDLTFVPLYADRLHIVAVRDHPLRGKSNLSLHRLADAEWMVPPPDTRVRRQIDAMFRKHGILAPRLRVETDFGNLSIFRLMQDTHLLSICGDQTLDQLKSMGIEPLPITGVNFDRRVGIMYRPEAYLSPLAQRIIELLADCKSARLSKAASMRRGARRR